MRIIKNLLFSLIGIIIVLSVILAFILSSYNNQDYQKLLIQTVDNLSDYTLSIKGPFELNCSLTPVLSVSEIELHSKNNDSYVYIENFRIHLTLAPLLNNTLLINDLLLENMQINIQDSDEPTSANKLFSYLPMPIIEHAVLKNLQLISDSDDQIHKLDSLLITAKDRQAPLQLLGNGMFSGHEFDIEAQLGPLADIFAQSKPFPINLIANWKQAQLFINGTIADPAHGKGLDLVGKLNIPEIADVFTASTPLKGRLHGRAHIKGVLSEPELTEIQAVLVDKRLIDMQLTGSIGNLLTQEQTDLHLSGFTYEEELLKWILPDNSPPLNSFSIEADINKGSKNFILQNININLSNELGLKIDLTGNTQIVQQRQPFRSLDILATIHSKDTATVKPYLGEFLPEMGPIQGTAHISTQGHDFVLSDIDLLAGVDRKIQLVAKGRVGPISIDEHSHANKIALDLALKAQHSSELSSLLKIKHPEIGPVAMAARLNGSFDKLTLEDITLKAGSPDVLSIQADGWIAWDKLNSDSPQQSTDFTIQAHSPSLQNTSRLYGEYSPDLGPAKASMRVHGKGMVLKGTGLTMQIGTANSLLFTVKGKIAQMFYADLFFKGIELTGSVKGKSTSHLSKLLENKKIPDIGSLSGEFMIQGDSNSFRAPLITLSAGRKNQLMLFASGKIAEISRRQQIPARGVDIALTAKAPSSADLSILAGSEIPDLGRLSIKGRLTDHNGIFAIKDLNISTGDDPNQPIVSISGSVKDVLSRSGLQMNILFDEKTLVKLFDLRPIPELGQLKGRALLSNASGRFSLNDIKLESGDSELISLKINGAIDDVTEVGQISANVDISIKQPELFGKLFAIDLSDFGPVSASGLLRGNKSRVKFKGNTFVGRTILNSELAWSLNEKVEISGIINSPNLFLEDFGITSTVSVTSQTEGAKPVKTELFSKAPIPLQTLHKADLDLQLRIYRMTAIDYKLDKVNIDLLLKNGKLSVNPVHFVFSEGEVLMSAGIDAKTEPELLLNIRGDDINLGEVLRQKDSSPPFSGKLNLVVDLKASGSSVNEIAANLSGEFGLSLENGGINRSQLELVFLNPLGWLFSYGISKNEIRISCGLARYQAKQGFIRSKVFLIDGPKFLTRGKTEINLVNETINSLYHLQKKNIFKNTIMPAFFDTNVVIKVTGKLDDLSVEEAPLSSVGAKADRYIFAPVATIPREILGTVFEVFDDNKEQQSPCQAYLEK